MLPRLRAKGTRTPRTCPRARTFRERPGAKACHEREREDGASGRLARQARNPPRIKPYKHPRYARCLYGASGWIRTNSVYPEGPVLRTGARPPSSQPTHVCHMVEAVGLEPTSRNDPARLLRPLRMPVPPRLRIRINMVGMTGFEPVRDLRPTGTSSRRVCQFRHTPVWCRRGESNSGFRIEGPAS